MFLLLIVIQHSYISALYNLLCDQPVPLLNCVRIQVWHISSQIFIANMTKNKN